MLRRARSTSLWGFRATQASHPSSARHFVISFGEPTNEYTIKRQQPWTLTLAGLLSTLQSRKKSNLRSRRDERFEGNLRHACHQQLAAQAQVRIPSLHARFSDELSLANRMCSSLAEVLVCLDLPWQHGQQLHGRRGCQAPRCGAPKQHKPHLYRVRATVLLIWQTH